MGSLNNSSQPTGSLDNISPDNCTYTVNTLIKNINSPGLLGIVTQDNLTNLLYFCSKGFEAEENDKFSKPLVWIGVYMAVASFACILCMAADSLHAILGNERYKFSSKYTSLNVTSMMVITIAMKLTVDLTGSMPSNLDQMAKIGSIAFMCTIMVILNPSLASMSNKTLLANIIGFVIFIVTIVVNLFIEIYTDVIRNDDEGPKNHVSTNKKQGTWIAVDPLDYSVDFANFTYAYIVIMILLLLISISTAINIPSVKKILEFKYQVRREDINGQPQHTRIPTVEEVTQHVTKYWIMAKTGSPQFVMACNLLSYTSLLLCAIGLFMHLGMLTTLHERYAYDKRLESDYRWSISVILWTQVTGNIIGVGLVIFRCIRSIKFKKVTWWEINDLFKLKEDKYWAVRLFEWKRSHLGFQSSDPIPRSRILHFMKKYGLSLLVGVQKLLILINRFFALLCIVFLKLVIKVFDVRRSTTPVVERNDDKNLGKYVLQLDNEVPSLDFLENIKKSMDNLIKRAKKKENKDLLDLLKKSNDLKGVENFDDISLDTGFDPLPPSINLNSWSLPVVTLTCIAIAVPGITKNKVRSLIRSIDGALLYTHHVDKCFNCARVYANIRKTAISLWYEVRERKWLKKPIGEGEFGQQLPGNILDSFKGKAETILKKHSTIGEEHMVEFPSEFIAAHLMHRITCSILSTYPQDEIQTNERFFELLSSMIADILVACFSNIPQVIMMKCHADEIEKREACVEAAAKLLGSTTEIIQNLKDRKLLGMDPKKMGSIENWRLHLKQLSFP